MKMLRSCPPARIFSFYAHAISIMFNAEGRLFKVAVIQLVVFV